MYLSLIVGRQLRNINSVLILKTHTQTFIESLTNLKLSFGIRTYTILINKDNQVKTQYVPSPWFLFRPTSRLSLRQMTKIVCVYMGRDKEESLSEYIVY